MKTLAVIPARYASTRLPGKPLIEIAGIPLVVRVLENVSKCSNVDRVIVATDDERIAELVSRHGGEAVMTPPELPSGGDRVAYVARRVPSDYVLNVQVDDPLVGADMIDPLVAALDADPSVMLALLVKRIERMEEVEDTSVVKASSTRADARSTSAARPSRTRGATAAYGTNTSAPTAGAGLPARFRRVGADSARKDGEPRNAARPRTRPYDTLRRGAARHNRNRHSGRSRKDSQILRGSVI